MDSIILTLALFFSFISIELFAIDYRSGKDNYINQRLLSKILACVFWGLFHFYTH